MKTNQLLVRSAVTIVAGGLTLLSTGTSEAHGSGHGGMRMSAAHGSMATGAIQSMGSRAFTRANAPAMTGRNQINNGAGRTVKMRDDRGGHGERRHGRDDGIGHNSSITRGEREPGDDHGRHRERRDDKGRGNSITRGEREPGDDHGHHRHHDDRR